MLGGSFPDLSEPLGEGTVVGVAERLRDLDVLRDAAVEQDHDLPVLVVKESEFEPLVGGAADVDTEGYGEAIPIPVGRRFAIYSG